MLHLQTDDEAPDSDVRWRTQYMLKLCLQPWEKMLQQELKCQRCTNQMRPPFKMCPSGHIACNKCSSKTCQRCNENVTAVINTTMEKIALELTYPCLYNEKGCTETKVLTDMAFHENQCEFRPYICPMFKKECLWTGLRTEIPAHLFEKHMAYLIIVSPNLPSVGLLTHTKYQIKLYDLLLERATYLNLVKLGHADYTEEIVTWFATDSATTDVIIVYFIIDKNALSCCCMHAGKSKAQNYHFSLSIKQQNPNVSMKHVCKVLSYDDDADITARSWKAAKIDMNFISYCKNKDTGATLEIEVFKK
ncbi:hypothetical protein C0J52_25928 [Blattella germanica]|nr:hypothetical protein C0J52_25928 [Blattella germanica]